jgi:molybdopterin biosynthesis enzyme
VLGNARDTLDELERLMRRGLEEDVLVLTGGVSAGKYDLVEVVLQARRRVHFDAVAIRPTACRFHLVSGSQSSACRQSGFDDGDL